jgi:hypothetical protein
VSQVVTDNVRLKVRRNRTFMLIGAAIVLLFTFAFAHLTMTAIQVRKNTSDVFMQWVINQHVGTAQIVHDSTGFDNDFCVLSVSKKIPVSQLEQQTFSLMKEYHTLDGGESLTIQYHDTATGKTTQESTAEYVSGSNTVFITLHQGPESSKVVKQRVQWAYVPSSS